MKYLVLCVFFCVGTAYANITHHTVIKNTVIKSPRLVVFKKPPVLRATGSVYTFNDNDDDDDDLVQDMHVGPERSKTASRKIYLDDKPLSPYVTVRLALARAKAMARYRELN